MITLTRKLGLILALFTILWSFTGLLYKGINYGIDFTGGVVTEFTSVKPLTQTMLLSTFEQHINGEFRLNSSQDGMSWTLRQSDQTTIAAQREILQQLITNDGLPVQLQESVFIGSQVGQELIEKGGLALWVSALCMMAYVTLRFEWRLAASSILALFHDVMLVLGCFAWFQIRFDLAVLAGLLAIMGYSLNDSIVIGDRIRELLKSKRFQNLDLLINTAVSSTFRRTIITSGTTLTTIIAIGLMAGDALGEFSLALGTGVLVGTLSSISIAATLPVFLNLPPDAYEVEEIGEDDVVEL